MRALFKLIIYIEILYSCIRNVIKVRSFLKSFCRVRLHSFFFIRTSNFDAEAERSYIFWRFEAETFLKMFLNLVYWFTGLLVPLSTIMQS